MVSARGGPDPAGFSVSRACDPISVCRKCSISSRPMSILRRFVTPPSIARHTVRELQKLRPSKASAEQQIEPS